MTKAQAQAKLFAYEEKNSDLQPHIRRLLGLFYLTANKLIPRAYIEEILGYGSSVLNRDISRRWWMILYYSGVPKRWKHFKTTAEKHGVPEAWRQLSPRLTSEERRLVLTRLGTKPWRASMEALRYYGRSVKGRVHWFKAGSWYTNSSWTWLLIEGKSLDSRRDYTEPWQEKIRPHARLLERECFHMTDPDKVTPPEAKGMIVKHVRLRLRELMGRKRGVAMVDVAWFLTAREICVSDSIWIAPKMQPSWVKNKRRQGAKKRMRGWR